MTHMTVHTFGDSHSWNGWGNEIEKHHLGPKLCHTFGKQQLKLVDLRHYDMKDGDTIIFCFGEIDCRCHVHKHITPETPYQQIIEVLVQNYIKAVETIVLTCGLKFKNICVFNVVPPVQRHNTAENPAYPYLGSDEERRTYVLYFNSLLKRDCASKQFVYFDVYDKYCDANGFLRKDLSDGNVHIRDGKYLAQFLLDLQKKECEC